MIGISTTINPDEWAYETYYASFGFGAKKAGHPSTSMCFLLQELPGTCNNGYLKEKMNQNKKNNMVLTVKYRWFLFKKKISLKQSNIDIGDSPFTGS